MKKVLSLLILWFLFSCETVVDVDLPEHDPKLVLHSFIEIPNYYHGYVCRVGQSVGLDDELPPFLYEADVTIKEEGGWSRNFYYSTPSSFFYLEADVEPKPGKTYILEANAPGLEPVSSRIEVPQIPEVTGSTYEEVDGIDFRQVPFNEATITIQDDPNEENYYEISAYIQNRSFDSSYYHVYTWSYDPLTEEMMDGQGILLNDKTFNGGSVTLNLRMENTYIEPENHHVTIWVRGITRSKYIYVKTLRVLQENQFNPFAEPITMPTNVENGYGIFAVDAINRYVIF